MKIVFFLSILLLLSACDQCKNLDCVSNELNAEFEILRWADRADLLSGPSKKYDAHEIDFFALNGNDTVKFYKEVIQTGSAPIVLHVQYTTISNRTFMRLSDGDVDTIDLTFNKESTKCCGTITRITHFRINEQQNLEATHYHEPILK